MLSQLGYVALPPAIVDKLHEGRTLSTDEMQIMGAVPDIANKLLDHIPRRGWRLRPFRPDDLRAFMEAAGLFARAAADPNQQTVH